MSATPNSRSRATNAARSETPSASSTTGGSVLGPTFSPREERRRSKISSGGLSDMSLYTSSAHVSKVKDLRGKTLTWDMIPHWMRDNEYIRSGYRREQNSWKGCLESVFGYLHNETVNIQTHLWGAVFFTLLLIITLCKTIHLHPTVTWYDIAGFVVFLLSAIICLSFSAALHTANCHSIKVAKQCVVLDYSGILALIVGSFFPSVYYGFYCYPEFLRFYFCSIILAGLGAAYVVLTPVYNTPEYRWSRTSVFLALGLTGIVPIMHASRLHGLSTLRDGMGFNWLLLSGVLYIVGASLYAARLPERLFPGKVDYFGASHQLFHITVVLAAIAHYVSIYTAYNHQHSTNAATCPVATLPSQKSVTFENFGKEAPLEEVSRILGNLF